MMNEYIIRQFFNHIYQMVVKVAEAIWVAAAVMVLVWFFLRLIEKRKKRKRENIYIKLTYCFYLTTLFYISILSRPLGSVSEIDLIPFNMPGGTRYIILYAATNALVFIPIGILLPLVCKRMKKAKSVVFVGVGISFFIETVQLILCCGVVQTEDLIMNTLGTVIGYWIYSIIKKRREKGC